MGQACGSWRSGIEERENHEGRGEVLREEIAMGSGSTLSSLLLVELCLLLVAFVSCKGGPVLVSL
jgi:hypothetical protein